jgi:hypothetical protein
MGKWRPVKDNTTISIKTATCCFIPMVELYTIRIIKSCLIWRWFTWTFSTQSNYGSKTKQSLIYNYYIFTVDQPLPANADDNPLNDLDINNGLNYSLVDVRLNSLGDILNTEKNIHLITYNPNDRRNRNINVPEKIAAVSTWRCLFWAITYFL